MSLERLLLLMGAGWVDEYVAFILILFVSQNEHEAYPWRW
jgi:hypothetical protein